MIKIELTPLLRVKTKDHVENSNYFYKWQRKNPLIVCKLSACKTFVTFYDDSMFEQFKACYGKPFRRLY